MFVSEEIGYGCIQTNEQFVLNVEFCTFEYFYYLGRGLRLLLKFKHKILWFVNTVICYGDRSCRVLRNTCVYNEQATRCIKFEYSGKQKSVYRISRRQHLLTEKHRSKWHETEIRRDIAVHSFGSDSNLTCTELVY